MADELDRDPTSDRTKFEWSRISQWQGDSLSDKGILILQPLSNGALLFGPSQGRQGIMTQAVDKLTGETSASGALKPLDLRYHLNFAIKTMAEGKGSNNMRVLVVGPRLSDRLDGTICYHLRSSELREVVKVLDPKANNIRLAFVELVKGDAPLGGKEYKQTSFEGLVECNLQDTPMADSAKAFLLKSAFLAAPARREALGNLAKLLNAYFANHGG
jgi:hypothetical protein